MRSRSLWCEVLVERAMLLPAKMTLSGKALSCTVMEWRMNVGVQILERLDWRGGYRMNNVIE